MIEFDEARDVILIIASSVFVHGAVRSIENHLLFRTFRHGLAPEVWQEQTTGATPAEGMLGREFDRFTTSTKRPDGYHRLLSVAEG